MFRLPGVFYWLKSMKRYFVIIPAAGTGSRFGAEKPKQYLPLLHYPLLWHTLKVFCACERISRIWVVLSPEDQEWQKTAWHLLGAKVEMVACGGASRAESVRNGLIAAQTAIADDDWVLVHDAARPCLASATLEQFLDRLADDPVGGLLAVPVADTLKRENTAGRVAETYPRAGLWQAQTPQMFPYRLLSDALANSASDPAITDEASAIEALGLQPRLVTGENTNFKVTYPSDLPLAELILRSRIEQEYS